MISLIRVSFGMDERLQVVHVGLILHSLLKLEKRGVLEEHHGKGAYEGILHRTIVLCFLPGIGKGGKPS
jgi:hypothetical protein